MDPFANISEQRTIAANFTAAADSDTLGADFDAVAEGCRLAELVIALDGWRLTGGFDPYASASYPYDSPDVSARMLTDYGAYVWHSGGGIMLTRIDFGDPLHPDEQGVDEVPYVL